MKYSNILSCTYFALKEMNGLFLTGLFSFACELQFRPTLSVRKLSWHKKIF